MAKADLLKKIGNISKRPGEKNLRAATVEIRYEWQATKTVSQSTITWDSFRLKIRKSDSETRYTKNYHIEKYLYPVFVCTLRRSIATQIKVSQLDSSDDLRIWFGGPVSFGPILKVLLPHKDDKEKVRIPSETLKGLSSIYIVWMA